MSKYHINEKGNPGACKASLGNCPFGGEKEHYSTQEDARNAYEKFMGGGNWSTAVQNNSEAVKSSNKGDYFLLDDRLYKVLYNSSGRYNEYNLDLREYDADGFERAKEYIRDGDGKFEPDVKKMKKVSYAQAISHMGQAFPDGLMAQALKENAVDPESALKSIVNSGEDLSLIESSVGDYFNKEGKVYGVLRKTYSSDGEVSGLCLYPQNADAFSNDTIIVSGDELAGYKKVSAEAKARLSKELETIGEHTIDKVYSQIEDRVNNETAKAEAELQQAKKDFDEGKIDYGSYYYYPRRVRNLVEDKMSLDLRNNPHDKKIILEANLAMAKLEHDEMSYYLKDEERKRGPIRRVSPGRSIENARHNVNNTANHVSRSQDALDNFLKTGA